ncbi:DoxX family protein [Bacillus timonensis]|nr:DoxX family protein [Bacillus timonensis]
MEVGQEAYIVWRNFDSEVFFVNVGILLIRITVGLTLAGHGVQKLFGWFGGPGLKEAGVHFETVGIYPGEQMALAAGLLECIGGLMLALGLLTPIGSLMIIVTMLMAILKVHGPNGYWMNQKGFEYNLLIIVASFACILIGAGRYSIDYLLSSRRR